MAEVYRGTESIISKRGKSNENLVSRQTRLRNTPLFLLVARGTLIFVSP